ncbi:MAG: AbrB/MazE/SpoVT family DNA-binding domain-containing protein [Defluviitaleaceae bacterium]|nr:AbrB/MazE/SpoVT family DNA-binding domain-containing protein [Defluviitaleaceae bacterium]
MKSITRRVDELGRIVIPYEVRKKFDWKEGVDILINITKNGISLETNT